MYYYLYDTATGIIVGGPLPNESDAIRLSNRYANWEYASIAEKIEGTVGSGRYKTPAKIVDSVTLQLRDWTQTEIDDYNAANSVEENTKKTRKESARDNKGQGGSVNDIRERLDNLIEVLQDAGLIPK